jgi:hypothetical protein
VTDADPWADVDRVLVTTNTSSRYHLIHPDSTEDDPWPLCGVSASSWSLRRAENTMSHEPCQNCETMVGGEDRSTSSRTGSLTCSLCGSTVKNSIADHIRWGECPEVPPPPDEGGKPPPSPGINDAARPR